ncbi:TolC family protein [Labilibaculum sp.]|uniref:TolC family protein n=1 Tax=Labilibaculum sp. TaxID=2060723 RepID=UPI0035669EFA
MKNILLALLIYAGFSIPTNAQTESKLKLSLFEAQEYALQNSYSVKGSEYDLKIAKKKVWEAIADGLPQIDFSGDYNNNLDVAVSLLPSEFFGGEEGTYTAIKFSQQYTSSAGITVNQKIFDGSYIVGTMAAKVFVQLTKDQKEKTEIEIKEVVAQAYFTVLVAQDNYKTIRENLIINEKLLVETDAYFKNGFREELDVDQIRLNLNKTKAKMSDAKRAINNSLIILKFSIGMDVDANLELSDELDNLVNPIRAEVPVIADHDLSKHIDYRILDTQLEAQKLIIKNEQADNLPTISAYYQYSKSASTDYSNVFRSEVPWYKSSVIGLQVDVPIFSGGKRKSQIQQEKITYKSLENDLLTTEQSLKKDVNLTFSDFLSAQENYENDREALQIAKRIYDRTRIKFNEGISSSTEFSENENQYLDTHSAYISSTLELLNTKIAFEKALGKL